MKRNRRPHAGRPSTGDAGPVPTPAERLGYYPCNWDGVATFSVLYADSDEPWGFASMPVEDDEEWWVDD